MDMIGPYSKSIRKQQPGAAIIRNNDSIACMTAIGRFKIVKVPTYNLNEVTGSDDEYIDKSLASVRKLFNKKWLRRYPRPRRVFLDNGYEFKRDLNNLIKELDITPVLTKNKKTHSNDPVDRLQQVIINMIATKYLANKVFEYIDP